MCPEFAGPAPKTRICGFRTAENRPVQPGRANSAANPKTNPPNQRFPSVRSGAPDCDSGRARFRRAFRAVDEVCAIGVSVKPKPQAVDPRFLIA